MGLIQKIFGTYSQRELKSIYPIADKIEALEEEYKGLTDAQLQAKTPEFKSMSKKELAALDRERQKLERNLQGIRNMGGAPDAMVAIGADHEDIAIREAHRLNIPVCVLVDTNADPKDIDFPIPGNDDAVRSIRLILDCIVKAINEGKGAAANA